MDLDGLSGKFCLLHLLVLDTVVLASIVDFLLGIPTLVVAENSSCTFVTSSLDSSHSLLESSPVWKRSCDEQVNKLSGSVVKSAK